MLDRIVKIVNNYDIVFDSEASLQASLADIFKINGVDFRREVALTPKDRIDFLTADGIGIEIKIDGALAAVTRQIARYTQSPQIQGVVVVTSKSQHLRLPDCLNGKPIETCFLFRSAF